MKVLIRQALSLALPVIFSYLSVAVYLNLDYAMVGQLGNKAMAAVGLSSWVFLILFLTFNALEVGVQVMVARLVGEKDYRGAGRVFSSALTVALGLGSMFTVLVMIFADWCVVASPEIRAMGAGFLRWRMAGFVMVMAMFAMTGFFNGIGKPVLPMAAQVTGNLINLFFNWLLIYGNWGFPAMGVRGAGLASTIGVTAGCLIMIGGLMRGKYRARFGYSVLQPPDRPILCRLVNIGYPIALQALLINGGFLVFLYINKSISLTAVSITQTVIYITTLSFLPVVGIGVAAATMVGQYLGALSPGRALRSGWIAVVMGSVTMIAFSLVYFLFGESILHWYIEDDAEVTREFVEMGIIVLRIVAVFQIFDAVGVVMGRVLQSAGYAKFVMVSEVSLFWLVFLPAAYINGIVLEHGVIGTWSAFVLYLMSYATVMLIKYVRGGWVHGRL
ncbi:MAG: MATE family efflux transporter [Candidatus Sumerlaeia bacterium]